MKSLILVLLFCFGCASKSDMKKLRYDLNMLHSYNQRLLETAERTRGYSASIIPKPLPIDIFAVPFPQPPPEVRTVYVFTNSQSRMQADPEWLKSVNGTPYYADSESVKRMQRRLQALERLLQEAKTIEENR